MKLIFSIIISILISITLIKPSPAIPPFLTISTNDTDFTFDDTLHLGATTKTGDERVDIYLVIVIPGFSNPFFFPFFTQELRPLATNIILPDFSSEKVFEFTFKQGLPIPEGEYRWLAALTKAGTFNILGEIQIASFNFKALLMKILSITSTDGKNPNASVRFNRPLDLSTVVPNIEIDLITEGLPPVLAGLLPFTKIEKGKAGDFFNFSQEEKGKVLVITPKEDFFKRAAPALRSFQVQAIQIKIRVFTGIMSADGVPLSPRTIGPLSFSLGQ